MASRSLYSEDDKKYGLDGIGVAEESSLQVDWTPGEEKRAKRK